jgi:hypothetical protein
MASARVFLLCFALLLGACDRAGSKGAAGDVATRQAATCGAPGSSQDVYSRLRANCVGCHGSGASKPYFASFKSFQDLLMTDARFVVAGQPEQSGLIALLEGTASGSYPEMPIGKSFKKLEEEHATTIRIDEVRTWLSTLTADQTKGGLAKADPNARTVRPLRAAEITHNLMELLGLTYADFGASADQLNFFREGRYFIYPNTDLTIAKDDWPGRAHYQALGGGNFLAGAPPEKQTSATALQVMLQASVRYCRGSLGRLMKKASLSDTSATNPAAIHQNIRYLFLHLTGTDASTEQIENLYQEVYLPYETNSTSSAWQAVCAQLLLRPEALTL